MDIAANWTAATIAGKMKTHLGYVTMRSLLALVALGAAFPAYAAETITYTYDAQGRLVNVVRSGTVNNGQQATYSYDAADNRTNVTVTGAPR